MGGWPGAKSYHSPPFTFLCSKHTTYIHVNDRKQAVFLCICKRQLNTLTLMNWWSQKNCRLFMLQTNVDKGSPEVPRQWRNIPLDGSRPVMRQKEIQSWRARRALYHLGGWATKIIKTVTFGKIYQKQSWWLHELKILCRSMADTATSGESQRSYMYATWARAAGQSVSLNAARIYGNSNISSTIFYRKVWNTLLHNGSTFHRIFLILKCHSRIWSNQGPLENIYIILCTKMGN